MTRFRFLVAKLAAATLLVSAAGAQTPDGDGARTPDVFVENRGQWSGEFLYRAALGPMTVFIDGHGWWFTLSQRDQARRAVHGAAVRMKIAAGSAVAVEVEEAAPGVHHYYPGNDSGRWRTSVPLARSLLLRGARPGVDVRAAMDGGRFKYDVLVSPGVDLASVVVEVEGARALRLDSDGALVIETALGAVRQPRPTTWQTGPGGRRKAVACDYVLIDARRFGFSAPTWDRRRALVIDPLLLGTLVGGGGGESVVAGSVGSTDEVTLTGYTSSADFPTTTGAFSTTLQGSEQLFVTRLNADMSGLSYSTYFGGTTADAVEDLAVNATGATVIVGTTFSLDFPALPSPGAPPAPTGSGSRPFVTMFDDDGMLTYSVFIVGLGDFQTATAVALDAAGEATVAGNADGPHPTTPGAYDTTYDAGFDVFVFRLSADGSTLQWGTLIGGSGFDVANDLAVAANGETTIVGWTTSPDFPTTPGVVGPTTGESFVARLNATGTALVYSTRVEGAQLTRVALGGPAEAEVTATGEALPGFAPTPGAYASSPGGMTDACVVRLDATAGAYVFAAYFGWSDVDEIKAVAVDATGSVLVAGRTKSWDFPATVACLQRIYRGDGDAFVAKLTPDAAAVVYATFLGGLASDRASVVAFGAQGSVTVAGVTLSSGFPTTAGAISSTLGGASDAFVVRIPIVPLLMAPEDQSIQVGGTGLFMIVGPPGAQLALLFDVASANVPLPPFGTLGVPYPSWMMLDGIGLGEPSAIPYALAIPPSGVFWFWTDPAPPEVAGFTFYVQAIAVSSAYPAGAALSAHLGQIHVDPACQLHVLP